MKKNSLIIILLLIIVILPSKVLAISNPYSKYETISRTKDKMINCTWYAWQQAYEKKGVALPSFGNAKNWYKKASSAGYKVGSTPKVNSIAVYTYETYGHVAYVVSLDGEYMTVNEGGVYTYEQKFDDDGNLISSKKVAYNKTGIYEGNISTSIVGRHRYDDNESSSILTGFIYLDELPQNTTTTTIKKATSTIKMTTPPPTIITSIATTLDSTTSSTVSSTTSISSISTKAIESVKLSQKNFSNNKKMLIFIIVIIIFIIIIAICLNKKKPHQ